MPDLFSIWQLLGPFIGPQNTGFSGPGSMVSFKTFI